MKPPKEWENGLIADCWHCGKEFQKTEYCFVCGYYICPSCHQCGCHLMPEVKKAMDKTFQALKPIFENWTKSKKKLERIHAQFMALEYILDTTNQKRKRQDKEVNKAWGLAVNTKGLINDLLPLYQGSFLTYHYSARQKTINPTWSKRRKKVFEIVQASLANEEMKK